MDLSTRVLGTHTVQRLRERTEAPVLMLGTDRFTRADLASVTCFNFTAAQNLWKATTELGVKNTRELYETVAPSALAVPRVGVIALAVLGAAFEVKGIGGDRPLENWMQKHAKQHAAHPIITFHSVKVQAQKEQREERRTRKQRKQARKNRAHQLRTQGYLERKEGAETLQ